MRDDLRRTRASRARVDPRPAPAHDRATGRFTCGAIPIAATPVELR
jgi:hypothetical protein